MPSRWQSSGNVKAEKYRMTTEGHNKTLGTMYLAWGSLSGLIMLILGFLFVVTTPVVRSGMHSRDGMPLAMYITVVTLIAVFGLLLSVPSLAAGYALLKQKAWARVAGIIAAIIASLNFPFGMALCVYTFWFLYGRGAHLYDQSAIAARDRFHLPYGEPSTFEFTADRSGDRRSQHEYVPPPQMPNWRD